jgi:hypothetical protein
MIDQNYVQELKRAGKDLPPWLRSPCLGDVVIVKNIYTCDGSLGIVLDVNYGDGWILVKIGEGNDDRVLARVHNLEVIDHIEPEPEDTKEELILRWLSGHDTGASSEAIALRALGLKKPENKWDYPHDNGDFGRCYRLLKACPSIDINIMKDVSPVWTQLVRVWVDLTRMYKAELSVYPIIMLILDLIPVEDGGLNQNLISRS